MKRWPTLLAAVASLVSGACAQPGLYNWGSYEEDLYKLYKTPESESAFRDDLAKMLSTANKKGTQPPPGVAAEYGFLVYRAGRYDEAIASFDLERRTWPESGTLMTTIIERVDQEKHKGETTTPDSADSASQQTAEPISAPAVSAPAAP